MLDGTKYYECQCGSPSHTLRFVLDLDPEFPTLYTELMMSHYLPWYKRIWVAIKYIFRYDTTDHYGSWELKPEDADDLINLLIKLKTANT